MRLAITGVRKFWTRTATFVSLIVAMIIVSLEFIFIGIAWRSAPAGGTSGLDRDTVQSLLTFPKAFDGVLAIVFAYGGLIALIYVASVSGSEWTWGTLKVAVSRGESRARYVIATFASLSLIMLGGLLLLFAVGILAAVIGASIAGLPVGSIGDGPTMLAVAGKVVRSWIAISCLASVGYAIAMIAKSQMAGIGAVIGFFIASIIGPALLPEIVQQIFRYLPFSIASNAIDLSFGSERSATSVGIEPTLALAVTIAWIIGSVGAAALATERTEIKG